MVGRTAIGIPIRSAKSAIRSCSVGKNSAIAVVFSSDSGVEGARVELVDGHAIRERERLNVPVSAKPIDQTLGRATQIATRKGEVLTPQEIAAVQGCGMQKRGLPFGVAELLEGSDCARRGRHSERISGM